MLKNLEFYAFHGVPDEEQAVGHRYCLSAELKVSGDADLTDEIGGTVDYGELGRQITSWSKERRFRTIEALAAWLAERILDEHSLVESVGIELWKRLPPADMIAEATGVRVSRSRGASPEVSRCLESEPGAPESR